MTGPTKEHLRTHPHGSYIQNKIWKVTTDYGIKQPKKNMYYWQDLSFVYYAKSSDLIQEKVVDFYFLNF